MFLQRFGFGGAQSFSWKSRLGARRLVLALGAAGFVLSACEEACAGRPIEDEEGKPYACVAPVDCPRPGSGVLCTNTTERLGNCIDCIHNVCTLFDEAFCG